MVCLASECERQWPTGSPGVCNNITDLCDCPPGFTGRDVWQNFDSCHISEVAISSVSTAFLVWNVFAICVTLCCTSYMLFAIVNAEDVYRSISRRNLLSSTSSSENYTGQSLGTGETDLNVRSYKFIKTRKKMIFLAVLMLFLYPVFSLPYAVLNTLEPPIYRYELRWVIDIFSGISIALLYGAFWVVLLIIYSSFPNLNLISKLLNIRSAFITNPKMFRNVVIGHIVVEMVTVVLTLGLLPSVFFDDEFSMLFSQLFVYLSIGFVLEFTTVFLGVCLVVRRLYRMAKETLQDQPGVLDVAKIKKASKNVGIMMIGVSLGTLVGVVPFIAMLTEIGSRYTFILYFVCAIGGYGLAMMGSLILAREFQYAKPDSSRSRLKQRRASEMPTIIHSI